MEKKELVRTIKFIAISASAGVIEFGVFSFMKKFTDFQYWPCYLTALIISVVWCFTINRRYTFRSTKNVPRAMALILLFYAFFTPLSTLFGEYLVSAKGINPYLVTAINMLLNLTLEYLYDMFIVYRNEKDNNIIAMREMKKPF